MHISCAANNYPANNMDETQKKDLALTVMATLDSKLTIYASRATSLSKYNNGAKSKRSCLIL